MVAADPEAEERWALAAIVADALARADRLGLGIVGIHLSHALELLNEADRRATIGAAG